MRDSCEEGDDYAEGYAAGETHQRSYLRGIELVDHDCICVIITLLSHISISHLY